jgi:hypothetical protein
MARPAGAKNKVSGQAKENIQAVFTRLGGTAAMAKWAEKNQNAFYAIYAKLLPHEVSVVDGAPINILAKPEDVGSL